jgi:carboxypeptidase C (cathepsin A)
MAKRPAPKKRIKTADEIKETPPKKLQGSKQKGSLSTKGGRIEYEAVADWIVIRKNEKPAADIFYSAYFKKGGDPKRPVTFVFNGGPGAASAYLHVGALGPKRVPFDDKGVPLPPPASLVENSESWLPFTDLVFIDPVGTGFSRITHKDAAEEGDKKEGDAAAKPAAPSKEPENEKEFYALNRDLESICEFIQRFLSQYKRWSSPIFIAGESYGGYRVAKLARKLQEDKYGVGLAGAILISPALEPNSLDPSDYDCLAWIEVFPTMAASARVHGKTRKTGYKSVEAFLEAAEEFAVGPLLSWLTLGARLSKDRIEEISAEMADWLGLPEPFVRKKAGRISLFDFSRELLRDQEIVLGIYDASITALDPFPDRPVFNGADPTLIGIDRVFTGGIQILLREWFDLKTDREYFLLSNQVNLDWKHDAPRHFFQTQMGATDDLRYGMALNPHLKVFLTHGLYDMVTPYFGSNRVVDLMKLHPSLRKNMTIRHFEGGHMFYAWKKSREQFVAAMRDFYKSAVVSK